MVADLSCSILSTKYIINIAINRHIFICDSGSYVGLSRLHITVKWISFCMLLQFKCTLSKCASLLDFPLWNSDRFVGEVSVSYLLNAGRQPVHPAVKVIGWNYSSVVVTLSTGWSGLRSLNMEHTSKNDVDLYKK